MFDLTGKVALVTGSARGIGRGIARCLAEAGADICINYVSESSKELAMDAAQSIRDMGRSVLVVSGDVSAQENVARIMEEIDKNFGRLDILVNNAGINSDKNIDTLDLDEWNRILKTNLTSGFLCSKYALPFMRRNHFGRIIMISSLTGEQGALFGQIHYSSTKGAQISFAKTLARTVADDGITVNSIAPGVHLTDTLEEILIKSDPHRMDNTIERVPLHKLGTCEDVGYAAVFLASDEAGYITGTTLDVNGGIFMR